MLGFVTRTVRRILLVALVLSFGLCSCRNKAAGGGDFQAGMDAYADGDYKTALEKWRPLAEAGDPASQTNLGFLYYEGKGVPQNYEEALKWYRKAALNGYPDAAFNLGVAYSEGKGGQLVPMEGLGVMRHKTQALHWYQLAADSGYAPAQMLLGKIYLGGHGH